MITNIDYQNMPFEHLAHEIAQRYALEHGCTLEDAYWDLCRPSNPEGAEFWDKAKAQRDANRAAFQAWCTAYPHRVEVEYLSEPMFDWCDANVRFGAYGHSEGDGDGDGPHQMGFNDERDAAIFRSRWT